MPMKWQYVLQERTGSDEPGVSPRDLKMEEKIGDAHGVRQRSAALTVKPQKKRVCDTQTCLVPAE